MKQDGLKIEVKKYSCGYTVYVNGEVLLECLSESDVDGLTVREIKALLDM